MRAPAEKFLKEIVRAQRRLFIHNRGIRCKKLVSLSFSSSGLTTWIPQTFTVTSQHTRFHAVLHF